MTRDEAAAYAYRWIAAIVYQSEIDGQSKRVSENLRFGSSGVVVAAEVFHGPVPGTHA